MTWTTEGQRRFLHHHPPTFRNRFGRIACGGLACTALLMLSGCGGSGGGGRYSSLALPGINRLPADEIRASNAELAGMVGIAEPGSIYDENRHAILVSKVACNSFIKPCENVANPLEGSTPFTLYTPTFDPGDDISIAVRDDLLEQIPASTKLVSVSFLPGFAEFHGGDLPFAVVRGAGNTGEESFYSIYRDTTSEISEPYRTLAVLGFAANVAEATADDKLLFVAGYRRQRSGRIARHPNSTGCVGIEEACVYAPFVFALPPGSQEERRAVAGTSGSAPNVAMALASVLAIFPGTSGPDLIRLAKSCADPSPGMPGLGLADFRCMTKLDAGGEWRLVSGSEFASLITPTNLQALGFPGRAEIGGEFATGREGTRIVRLALRKPAQFDAADFSAGLPLMHPAGKTGLFPIASLDRESGSVGAGYAAGNGLFAAAAVGNSIGFFGLSPSFGYGGSSRVDVSAGHRNLFLRATRQWNEGDGRVLDAAEGAAVGVSAVGEREIAPGLRVSASVHADRFVGGNAATAFGSVRIGRSPWNRRAELSLRQSVGENAEYSVGGTFSRPGNRSASRELNAGFTIKF